MEGMETLEVGNFNKLELMELKLNLTVDEQLGPECG